MFTVVRNGRKVTNTFTTYESARQYVRKRLRKLVSARSKNQPETTLSAFGFTIKSN